MQQTRKRLIIGVTGQKRHGKDTIADYLVQKHGFTCKLAYADLLKHIVQPMFSFCDDQLYGDHKETVDKRWGISPRQALQFVGTLLRNNMHELIPDQQKGNFFVDAVRRQFEFIQGDIVISDVRQPNEAHAVDVLWHVERPSSVSTDTHETELGPVLLKTKADIRFINDGSKADLFLKIDQAIEKINAGRGRATGDAGTEKKADD